MLAGQIGGLLGLLAVLGQDVAMPLGPERGATDRTGGRLAEQVLLVAQLKQAVLLLLGVGFQRGVALAGVGDLRLQAGPLLVEPIELGVLGLGGRQLGPALFQAGGSALEAGQLCAELLAAAPELAAGLGYGPLPKGKVVA